MASPIHACDEAEFYSVLTRGGDWTDELRDPHGRAVGSPTGGIGWVGGRPVPSPHPSSMAQSECRLGGRDVDDDRQGFPCIDFAEEAAP